MVFVHLSRHIKPEINGVFYFIMLILKRSYIRRNMYKEGFLGRDFFMFINNTYWFKGYKPKNFIERGCFFNSFIKK